MNHLEELEKNFIKIAKMGYVRSVNKSLGGIGTTFEKLLGCNAESFEIPDYYNIEIKTKRAYSNCETTLFTSNPDGKNLFEVERLRNTYGYPDQKHKAYKVINGYVYANKTVNIGKRFSYKLKIDKIKEKLILEIYSENSIIDNDIWWSFELLKEKLLRKLKYLAVVNAWPTNRNSYPYYKYYKMELFKLKSFNAFLNAIENGYINIAINIGVFYSGKRCGQVHNHGIAFRINYENINQVFLFFKKVSYNYATDRLGVKYFNV